MPFMRGKGALRRTKEFLEKGEILLNEDIKVLLFGYTPLLKKYPHHTGLTRFIFWHLPQLKYKNPKVEMYTFKNMTPTPWIKAFLKDDSHLVIDCDSRSREDIHSHVKKVLGKSEAELLEEIQLEESRFHNPALFGFQFDRQCICEVPGQVPCPGWELFPKEMTGKYKKAQWEASRENE
ncbi:hypothetical protein CAPTEDRAFT_181516 [Capitella teleta]|uniref:Small ribosomal subunit protein mS25 n=1 Tax=Capitella teleta TaxID=283909 RepID=R7V758_CAPTE|nr:hypothetical protein CAPTEDRAFT_181516 [Capitella teleta]|eukprot:ELU11605.1 hypothetical protein CAPTEDRAFT_181516 [Capitella teleta]